MARPSQNLDAKLVKAGCELIQEEGLSRLSLRAVAKRAGVNLGMFHYHFKDKSEFTRRCVSEFYEEFYRGFELEITGPGSTLERLRRGLLSVAKLARDQRHLVFAILRDAADRQEEALDFIKRNLPPRHGRALVGLIRQAQKEGALVKLPIPQLMVFMMGALGGPSVMGGVAERVVGNKYLSLPRLALKRYVLSDDALETRVDLALRALMKHPEKHWRKF